MSSSIDQIKAPIVEELKIFQKKFKASFKSSVPLLDKITA
jgi:octaprenyl-diphosphate synthase